MCDIQAGTDEQTSSTDSIIMASQTALKESCCCKNYACAVIMSSLKASLQRG